MKQAGEHTPPAGLSIPLVTVFDRSGRILEDQQRRLVRYLIQQGSGADILFAAGTTGEWDRVDNPRRQLVSQITVEECAAARRAGFSVEGWAGITAPTAAETLDNLRHAIEINADAAVLSPLSLRDVGDYVSFVIREVGEVFERSGRSIPIFLYDNADISAPGKAPHMHTRDVKRLSRLDFIRGVKVTAGKAVLGNYTRAAAHFKARGEFGIYVGNAYLIFDLFLPPIGVAGHLRSYWNRYWTRAALPAGVVAGPANAMPREWHRAWRVCRSGDVDLMSKYGELLNGFRNACEFSTAAGTSRPTIACLKSALAELGVIDSPAVAPGTPALDEAQHREFARRWRSLRQRAAELLEARWLSSVDQSLAGIPHPASADKLRAI